MVSSVSSPGTPGTPVGSGVRQGVSEGVGPSAGGVVPSGADARTIKDAMFGSLNSIGDTSPVRPEGLKRLPKGPERTPSDQFSGSAHTLNRELSTESRPGSIGPGGRVAPPPLTPELEEILRPLASLASGRVHGNAIGKLGDRKDSPTWKLGEEVGERLARFFFQKSLHDGQSHAWTHPLRALPPKDLEAVLHSLSYAAGADTRISHADEDGLSNTQDKGKFSQRTAMMNGSGTTTTSASDPPAEFGYGGSGRGGTSEDNDQQPNEDETKKGGKGAETGSVDRETGLYEAVASGFLKTLQAISNAGSHSRTGREVGDGQSIAHQSSGADIGQRAVGSLVRLGARDPYVLVGGVIVRYLEIMRGFLQRAYKQFDTQVDSLSLMQDMLKQLGNFLASQRAIGGREADEKEFNLNNEYMTPPAILPLPGWCTNCQSEIDWPVGSGYVVGTMYVYSDLGKNYGAGGETVSEILLVPNGDFFDFDTTQQLAILAHYKITKMIRRDGTGGLSYFDLITFFGAAPDTGDPSTNINYAKNQKLPVLETLLGTASSVAQSRQSEASAASTQINNGIRRSNSAFQALSQIQRRLMDDIRFILRNTA